MALTFGAAVTDRVNHGTAVNLISDPCTVLAWIYPTNTNTRSIFGRGDAINANRQPQWRHAAGLNLEVIYDRLVTDAQFVTNTGFISSANRWYFVGYTFDSAVSPTVRIFGGTLMSRVTEQTCGTATDGVGILLLNIPAAIVGNTGQSDDAFRGKIAAVGLWNRVLTLGEIRAQQAQLCPTAGCVLLTYPGEFGSVNLQHDRSGYGNYGTVTGATYARASELDTIFMPTRRLIYPQEIAAAGDAVPQVWASYRRRRAA